MLKAVCTKVSHLNESIAVTLCSVSSQENYLKSLMRDISPALQTDSHSSELPKQPLRVLPMVSTAGRKNASSAQHNHSLTPYASSQPKNTEFKHLFSQKSEFSPFEVASSHTTPINSIINSKQSVEQSLSLLHQWFEHLDLNSWMPLTPAAGNLAAYVPRSETLSRLVELGVDLSKIEAIPGVANMLIKMDFHLKIEPVLWQLNSYGFELNQIARILTGFPKLLKLPLSELDVRFSYFTQHGFQQSAVLLMITKHPNLLELTCVDIDRQLGEIQSLFQFNGNQLRSCVQSIPKAILHPLVKIKDVYVVLTKMIGFPHKVVQSMVYSNPKLLVTERSRIATNFMFMYSRLNLSLERIQNWPSVLSSAPHLLSERATFLVRRGLLQPEPTKPLYTPLDEVINGTDAEFCERFGRTDEMDFNVFLKNM